MDKKFTYVKTNLYTETVHEAWMYILNHTDGIVVTAISANNTAVEFLPTTQEAVRFVQYLIDSDMGMVLTEKQRAFYEKDVSPLFLVSV